MAKLGRTLHSRFTSKKREVPWPIEHFDADMIAAIRPQLETKAPRVRAQRRRMTEAEKMLWPHLDHLAPGRSRFKKWEKVGSHVADFVCRETRVVILLDGMEHGLAGLRQADAAQAAWQKEGYRVLRFWNAEVLGQIEVVLDTIQAALFSAHRDGDAAVLSSPIPSPPGRGA